MGSYNGLYFFEEILSKLDADTDAIMIDRSTLGLELKFKQDIDKATSIFVKKSAFESVTSIVSGSFPEPGLPKARYTLAILDGADAVILDPEVAQPEAIRKFADHCVTTEKLIKPQINHHMPKPLHKILE